MPSTLVHVALAALVATALLGDRLDGRSLAVVLLAVIVVDLDVFVGLAVTGAHRAAFHTLVWPALAAAALVYDTAVRDRSALAARVGDGAPRLAWTTVAAVVFAAIGPDLVTNGANLLYPLHDQFYNLEGAIRLSDQRGFVQTFVELGDGDLLGGQGSSEQINISTGVDPDPSGKEETPERVFNVVRTGWGLLILVVGTLVTWARFRLSHALE